MSGPCRTAASRLVQTAARASLTHTTVKSIPALHHQMSLLSPALSPSVLSFSLARHFSSLKLSRNLEYLSASNVPLVVNKGSLCVEPPAGQAQTRTRPLTLLMCWLMAKEKHVRAYIRFYNDLGFDVLKIRVSPFDLLRPKNGAQVVAHQMLEFLHANPRHNNILIHGFSVGAYVFCEGMVQVANDLPRHGHLLERFVGQIWDSPVDVYGIPDGVPPAITDNAVLQSSLKKYLLWYLRTQRTTAGVHYERSSEKMHQCYVNAPGLFLFSKTDMVSSPAMNKMVYSKWEKKGVPVFVKCFDKSPHVSHYVKHKEAYRDEVISFIQRIGLLEESKRAKKTV